MGNQRRMFCIVCILISIVSWGCTGASQGPQAWIDYPLNNASLPLAPLSILAHASHTEGVASIEYYVNGDEINAVAVGGSKLEDATVEWNPPQPGRYRLEVRGVDSAGNAGSHAAAVITVGEFSRATTVTPSPVETTTITVTPTGTSETSTVTNTATVTQPTTTNTPQTPQPSLEPVVIADINANCRYGPSTLFEVYANLLQGQQANITGRLADNSWFLVIPPGRSSSCYIAASVVSVQGDLEPVPVVQPPPEPVTDTPTFTPTTPAPDTTPPTIIGNNLNPNQIMKEGPGCPTYSRTSVSTVTAQDNVAIGSVSANWVLRDFSNNIVASGSVNYSPAGGNNFQATFGPVNSDGTLSINGTVLDTSGNSAQFSQQINVLACIG